MLDDPGLVQIEGSQQVSALEHILQADLYPDLYKDFYHKVRIEYYPPRGDAKEGWDNIDIFGWLGYPMQIKINFLCRDSILAAPLVLDIVLFMDLAQRAGMRGMQEWLSFYFKAPMHAPELYPEHDIFIQLMKLKNTLRWMRGRGPDHASGPGILRLVSVSFEIRSPSGRRRRVLTVQESMKVLVIGGTLFIGRLLVEELVKAGHEVTVLHRKPKHDLGRRVENIMADRNDAESVREALSTRRFEVVFDNVYDWERGTTAAQVEATVQGRGRTPHAIRVSCRASPRTATG